MQQEPLCLHIKLLKQMWVSYETRDCTLQWKFSHLTTFPDSPPSPINQWLPYLTTSDWRWKQYVPPALWYTTRIQHSAVILWTTIQSHITVKTTCSYNFLGILSDVVEDNRTNYLSPCCKICCTHSTALYFERFLVTT